ncbi:MAG: translation elongation factor 4 [Gammaproteobacteria bacterium WSBS_2016_MAG_OTU1]
MLNSIRNFSIIAHIDHGKSTLADALIHLCGGLSSREMKAQVLDSMDIERERGITIKSQTATLGYHSLDGNDYILNLIDTPGHVDFSYEVSRSLSACEGALLVVDAAKGVQAQTIANSNVAVGLGLEIVPVINKVDLPAADFFRTCKEIEDMAGLDASAAIAVSAKTGQGAIDVLEAAVKYIPPPVGDAKAELQALIIDSWFDKYLGVVILVRIKNGILCRRERVYFMATGEERECEMLGVFTPKMEKREQLQAGEVGCVITGLKDISVARVGDTLTHLRRPCAVPLDGFKESKPHVFASIYPAIPADFPLLRDAAEKLQLNDAALAFETEKSPAFGFGLRCGFLGMLHMEITQERLEREYNLELVLAAPTVVYQVLTINNEEMLVDHPGRLPDPSKIREIREPIADVTVVTVGDFLGAVMTLLAKSRGVQKRTEYSSSQVVLYYEIPLSEILGGFFDRLKSVSQGYASMDYDFKFFRRAPVARLDILINSERVDALSSMVITEDAQARGRELALKIKEAIPRQMFDVAVQAAVGGKIIARETTKALRKNVTAKCYGGDITRKKKLLEKQKKGKKRMKQFGRVEISQDALLAAMRSDH